MKKKNTGRFAEFFAGKGFYVILLICMAMIGLSGYALFFSGASEPSNPDFFGNLSLQDNQDGWDIPSSAWLDDSQSTPSATPMWDKNGSDLDAQSVIGGNIAPPPVVPGAETTKPPPDQTRPETPEKSSSDQPTRYVWPTSGKVINPYAEDELVFNPTLGDWRAHLGIDIETAANETVSAICDGVVEDIYEDPLMGTSVVIAHEGNIRSVYANLSKVPTVSQGDSVRAGDTIGAVGGTAIGEISAPHHLHLEIFKGEEIQNPLDYLPNR